MKELLKRMNTPLYIGSILISFIIGVFCHTFIVEEYKNDEELENMVKAQQTKIDDYKVYLNSTEILLDSIYQLNEDTFHDTVMECDVYYNYEVARSKVM